MCVHNRMIIINIESTYGQINSPFFFKVHCTHKTRARGLSYEFNLLQKHATCLRFVKSKLISPTPRPSSSRPRRLMTSPEETGWRICWSSSWRRKHPSNIKVSNPRWVLPSVSILCSSISSTFMVLLITNNAWLRFLSASADQQILYPITAPGKRNMFSPILYLNLFFLSSIFTPSNFLHFSLRLLVFMWRDHSVHFLIPAGKWSDWDILYRNSSPPTISTSYRAIIINEKTKNKVCYVYLITNYIIHSIEFYSSHQS